jgi:hypothetical protein
MDNGQAVLRRFLAAVLVLASQFLSQSAFAADAASPPGFSEPIYTEIIPTSAALPYDPKTDVKESFQAPNGKTIEVLLKGPVGSGTYSRPIGPGETPDHYFPAVVNEAVAAKAHRLVIPKGTYDFDGPHLCENLASAKCQDPAACSAAQYWNCQPHWTIGTYPSGQVTTPDSLTDLDIDFSGSVLNFKAPVIGIWILETQRLRLRNFTIDWPALRIASLGTIVADPANPGHNALVIDNGYTVKDPFMGGHVQIQAVDIWDASAKDPPGRFDAKANNSFETYWIFGSAPQPTYEGKTAAGAQTFSCKSCNFQNSTTDPSCSFFAGCANFDGYAAGTRVIVRHYTYNGFALYVTWSNDVDLENLTLLTGPGMGIAVGSNGGYRGFRLHNSAVKRAPGRLISTASDAVNLSLQADLMIENNEIADQGDDGLNIHPVSSSVTAVNAASIQLPGVCDPDPMDNPIAGDALALYDANFAYLGTAHVKSVAGSFCGTLTLTLDHAVKGFTAAGQIVDMTQQFSARSIVRRNRFHDNRGHGVLINTPYALVADNTFAYNSMGGVASAAGNGNGPGATNLTLSGNSVFMPGQWTQDGGSINLIATTADGTILSSPLFEKILIANNRFDDMPGPALVMTSARFVDVAGAAIANANRDRSAPVFYGHVTSNDSIVLYKSDDAAICGVERSGSTGPVGVDPGDRGVVVSQKCK